MEEETLIKIPFAKGEDPLIYRSHLIFSQEQFDSISTDDILLAIDNQYNNWLAIINAPIDSEAPVDPEVTIDPEAPTDPEVE
jgi:hypothetical protein